MIKRNYLLRYGKIPVATHVTNLKVFIVRDWPAINRVITVLSWRVMYRRFLSDVSDDEYFVWSAKRIFYIRIKNDASRSEDIAAQLFTRLQ